LKSYQDICRSAIRTITSEIEELANLPKWVDEDFARSVELIYQSHGRVVVTGIGKSANIGRKLVATLNSTGSPALFMHAADAIHGDIGTITKEDVVVCISNSGDTPEIKVLVPILKSYGNKLIALCGRKDSFLAQNSDFLINTYVKREACPNNLAPTSSTTAQLIMGDALAVALLEYRNFSSQDFARNHPGGVLGKKMYLRLANIYTQNEKPCVGLKTPIKDVIVEMTSSRLGATAVMDNNQLKGIITDGDIRRMLSKYENIGAICAEDIMSPNPKALDENILVVDALSLMRNKNITQVLVLKNGLYSGVVHLHDILKEGII